MHVRVLGQIEVVVDGRAVDLGGAKPRLALALLLLEPNRVVPAGRLIDALWGDDEPADPRATLQVNVSKLRRSLREGDVSIDFTNGGYVAAVDEDVVDAHRFTALVAEGAALLPAEPARAATVLRDALGLWRGRPYGDLADEPALVGEVSRLERLRLRALEKRIDADLAVGDHERAVDELQQLTAEHPLHEVFWGQLMLALYRSGRQAEAVAAYDRAAARLREELGLDPAAPLRELHTRLLRQDPTLDAPVAVAAGSPDVVPVRTIRGYELHEEYGPGRLGVVHRGRQPGSDDPVAVEVIDDDRVDRPEFARWFRAVTDRAARLDHPNLGRLVDAWREPGQVCLVTEWIDGRPLTAVRGETTWQPVRVAALVEDLAGGLDAAAAAGMALAGCSARDVVVAEGGRAMLGSVAAMALDQLDRGAQPASGPWEDGDTAQAARTDVVTLAELAFELLSGVRPRSVRVAPGAGGDRLHTQLPPLGEVRPDLPASIGAVLARATAAGTGERYGSAVAFAADLSAAADVGGQAGADTPAVRNPYKGLQAFQEEDASDYFGRSGLVDRLLEVLDEGSVAIVGPSGSGKSSLVRAGLLPRLRAAGWFVVPMQPGEWPMAELERSLTEVAACDAATIARALGSGDDGLARAVDLVLPDPTGRLLLFVDQFEELYALGRHEDRAAFLRRLARCLGEASCERVRVVLTVRADFYDQLLLDPQLGGWVADRTMAVSPMGADELEAAITGPTRRVGVAVDPEVTASLVSGLAGSPGSLPLLQFTLTELFEAREGGRITLDAHDEVGGISGALVGRAERLYAQQDEVGRQLCRQMFLRLVTIANTPTETRRRVLRAELRGLGDDARVDGILEDFGGHRLLTFDRDPFTRMPTVAIAHEALTNEWGRLRGWIDGAREDIEAHRRLRGATDEWRLAEHDPSYLLRGSRLAEIEEWADGSGLQLTEGERRYLDESVAAREERLAEQRRQAAREQELEQRARRRLRAVAAVSAVAAVVAVALSAVAFQQRGQAQHQQQLAERQGRVAQARELAAAAVAELDADPQRSLLLAIEAVATTRDVDGTVLREAEEALHRAVVGSRMVDRFTGVGGQLALSPDGDLLVTEGPEESGLVDVRDAVTGQSVHAFQGHGPSFGDRPPDLNSVAFGPDGALLATTGDDGALRLWRRVWETGAEDESLVVEGDRLGAVWGPSFSPDGRLVAAAWADEGRVRVVDVTSGEVVLEVDQLAHPFGTAFSPDGTRLAVSLARGGSAVVLDAATGEQLHSLAGGDGRGITWSPDGRLLATTSSDGTASLWHAEDGTLRTTLYGHGAEVVSVAWSPDTARLATGSIDGTARSWRLAEGGAQQELVLGVSPKGVQGLAFSPDGTRLYAGEEGPAATTNVEVFDITRRGTAEVANLPGAHDGPSALAFGPDGDGLAVASGDGTVTHWRMAGGQPSVDLRVDAGASLLHDIEVSPDGALTAVAAGAALRLVETATGEERGVVDHAGLVGAVAWSPDGQVVATGDQFGGVRIVGRDGAEVGTLRPPDGSRAPGWAARSVAFSPDGQLLAVAGGDQLGQPESWHVELWAWRDGELETTLPTGQFNARTVTFDPDGGLLAVAGFGSVELFDTGSWDPTDELTGHGGGGVTSLAFSPDGEVLATGGVDGTVRLWDPAAASESLVLRGHDGEVEALSFSPDGSWLASGDRPGEVRVWALDLDELLAIARDELVRDLTDEECRQYLHRATC